MRLKSIIEGYFGFEIEEEPMTIDPDSQEIKDILEDILKYERFPAEGSLLSDKFLSKIIIEFSAEKISQRNRQLQSTQNQPQVSPTHELFVDKDMNPPLQKGIIHFF